MQKKTNDLNRDLVLLSKMTSDGLDSLDCKFGKQNEQAQIYVVKVNNELIKIQAELKKCLDKFGDEDLATQKANVLEFANIHGEQLSSLRDIIFTHEEKHTSLMNKVSQLEINFELKNKIQKVTSTADIKTLNKMIWRFVTFCSGWISTYKIQCCRALN